jgi:16S rRNA (cytidine1402-2'-O)-methyltransferase
MPSGESFANSLAAGLYLVATPIGNLEDITLRALRVLKEVDLIACEDTRQSQKLLNHHSISTRTTSYHEHNEAEKAHDLVAQLERGVRIALITDAGMPGVSDPGYRVVSLAIEHNIPVIPIPGASAFVSALAASGLPTNSFQFNGFLPAKQGARRQALEDVRNSSWTQAFYEAPHRVVESLQDVVEILGAERSVVIARELTKIHEEFLRGTAAGVLKTITERDNVKGEIVLLIGKAAPSTNNDPRKVSIHERMKQLMKEDNLDEKAALKRVAKEIGISKSDVYREWQRKGPRSS